MKRVGNLYEKIYDMDNLKLAVKHAIRGKRKRHSVQTFMANQEALLVKLQQSLIQGTYRPRPYGIKNIVDCSSGKQRQICIPKFYPDQILQWAVMQVIQPVLQKSMYYYSCASIRGKGCILGIRKVKKILERDYKNSKYCLVMDVRKYYPSIDQDLLMQKFRTKFKDEKLLQLLGLIVHSTPSGLPIGNYTSQWFANFYLTDMDHYIKETLKAKYYIRYMDDMVIIGSNKRKLHRIRESVQQYAIKNRLAIKDNWQVFRIGNYPGDGRGIDFLGFVFYKTCVTLRARVFVRSVRRLRKICNKKYISVADSGAVFSYLARYNISSSDKLYNSCVQDNISVQRCKDVYRKYMRGLHREEREMCSVHVSATIRQYVGMIRYQGGIIPYPDVGVITQCDVGSTPRMVA